MEGSQEYEAQPGCSCPWSWGTSESHCARFDPPAGRAAAGPTPSTSCRPGGCPWTPGAPGSGREKAGLVALKAPTVDSGGLMGKWPGRRGAGPTRERLSCSGRRRSPSLGVLLPRELWSGRGCAQMVVCWTLAWCGLREEVGPLRGGAQQVWGLLPLKGTKGLLWDLSQFSSRYKRARWASAHSLAPCQPCDYSLSLALP